MGACYRRRWAEEEKRKKKNTKSKTEQNMTNIIHNIKMAPIVITDRKIKFISSDVSVTGASIG